MLHFPLTTEQDVQLTLAEARDALIQKLILLFEALSKHPPEEFINQIFRIQLPVKSVDMIGWLMNQVIAPAVYWEDRSGEFEIVGVGAAVQIQGQTRKEYAVIIDEVQSYLENASDFVRFLGGFQFNGTREIEEKWKPFGAYWFFVPQLEIWRQEDVFNIALNFIVKAEEQLQEQLQRLIRFLKRILWQENRPKVQISGYVRRVDVPQFPQWKQMIETALHIFRTTDRDKLVLARCSSFEFLQPLNPVEIFRRLKGATPQTYHFYFQPRENTAFVGASPERLYHRSGRLIETEAVAGTRRRGDTPEEDRQLAEDLLASKKDVREHDLVVQSIRHVLQQLCDDYDVDSETSVIKLARVQHLCRRLKGVLKPNVADGEIIQKLHPTPAVGGYPTHNAEEAIETLEPFYRGWYAAPVGWIDRNGAEFAVAIRTGLIEQNHLHLYSGAGIVEGSVPEMEWEEIENKISNFLSVVQRLNGSKHH